MTQKELGYVELEWTCKHCGTINPGMNRVCSNCGAPIGQDDKFELPDQQVMITDQAKLDEAKAGPAIHCPYCQALNPANAKLCVQCGGDIQAGLARQAGEVLGAYQTAPVPDKPCPSCGQPVKANAERCPHCGGSLVETAPPVSPPAPSKKAPLWLIVGGIAIALLCLASVITFFVLSSRTSAVNALVADTRWQRSIEILEQQPVKRSSWSDDLPADAENVSCRDEYKETRSEPAPNATEVCGTPYTVDVGSGAGQVVQDCLYRVYASYCDYTALDLVVVNTAVAMGSDQNPYWPAANLLAGQQEGNRYESYAVTFAAQDTSYSYNPSNLEEYLRYLPGSEWILDVNTFGNINSIRQK
jgi:hypothetical protein